jgi:hypothetical protein
MSISKVLFLTLLLAVAGCDDDDDNPMGGNVPDETAPTIASIKTIDASHTEVKFSEVVDVAGAEDLGNYSIVETATPGGEPVDTLTVTRAVLKPDQRTVALTTSAMNEAPYRISITGVQDEEGNVIDEPVVRMFTGSDDPDTTPPELLSSDPADEARDVSTDPSIELVFSEPIALSSLTEGATLSSELGDVLFTAETDDSLHVTIVPDTPLEPDTRYTLEFSGIEDVLGNVMSTESFSFTTTKENLPD